MQGWYLKNIQPEQMTIKDTVVDDKLQKLDSKYSAGTEATLIGTAEAINIQPHLHKYDCVPPEW